MITCETCKTEFKAISEHFEKTKQAYECSASVFIHQGKTKILGHYGSTYCDGDLYVLAPGAPVELGIICDGCVRKQVDNGYATLESEGNYMGINA